MPIFRTAERSTETRINGFRLRRRGLLRQPGAAPEFIAVGTQGAGTGAVSPAWPARHQAGDLGILVVETSGGSSAVTVSGWTHVAGSPVTDVADATGSRLHVLWKFATSDQESAAAVPNMGDHAIGRVFAFRGVRQDVEPGRASATDAKTTASFTVSYPAITTIAPNSLVLCIASRPDDTASTTTFAGFANANLAGLAEAAEAGSTVGDGGGFVLNYGTRAAIGDIGASTGTLTVSVTNASMTLALEPSLALPA